MTDSHHQEEWRESLESAKDIIIDSLAETMDLYGVTRSVGTLYGTMYVEGDMTLDEMREKLGMSKPSMSTGVRKLQEFNVVKKTHRRGKRKQTYVAEKDFFRFFTNFFTQQWEREVRTNLSAIESAWEQLDMLMQSEDAEASIKEEAREIQRILSQSIKYYKWLGRLVEAMETGELFQYIPVEEDDDQER